MTQQSELGRPLRIVIPIIASPADSLAPECFRVAPATRDGDGVPEIANARIVVEQAGAGSQLVVSTTRPVNDPAVRIALQVGCENRVRREFVLLLDPEPVVAPALAATALPASRNDAASADVTDATAGATTRGVVPGAAILASPPAAPAVTEPPPPRRPARSAGATPGAPTAANRARARPTPRPAARPPPAAKAAPAKAPPATSSKPPAPPVAPVAPQPRLTVSSAAPAVTSAGAVPPKPVQSAQEATNALEAETIVLRQRVTELSELVERMQLEMRAAQASQAARLAAEEAARSAPQAVIRRWWDGAWPILAILVAAAALIAAGLAWKRRRGWPATTAWKTSRTLPDSIAPVSAPVAVVTAGPVDPAPAAAAAPTTQSDNVDVSELSHVTEEAGVYLAFNRIDRAIEVLREHIRGQPRSLPAAWLMLLEIYRTHGRETEFRELATEYHRQFNAQAPLWDADATPEDEANAGLEAFPHVVNQLVRLWGKPECREFLELLLYDNRDGRRVGFSPAAYSDILMLRQIADPAAVSLDAHHFGGHELRPAWAANPAKPEALEPVASRPASGAPATSGTPGPRPMPLEPLPDSPLASLASRAKVPAALDLEIAFDEDITKTAPAPRDKTPGAGSQGRS